jgi:hypothetical protein
MTTPTDPPHPTNPPDPRDPSLESRKAHPSNPSSSYSPRHLPPIDQPIDQPIDPELEAILAEEARIDEEATIRHLHAADDPRPPRPGPRAPHGTRPDGPTSNKPASGKVTPYLRLPLDSELDSAASVIQPLPGSPLGPIILELRRLGTTLLLQLAQLSDVAQEFMDLPPQPTLADLSREASVSAIQREHPDMNSLQIRVELLRQKELSCRAERIRTRQTMLIEEIDNLTHVLPEITSHLVRIDMATPFGPSNL